MTMFESEGAGSFEDSSDYEYETTSEDVIDECPPHHGHHHDRLRTLDQEPFVHFRSLNNYLNNLNLATFNFNLNNRFNAFVADSSLWKLYENSPRFPGVRVRVPPLPKPKIDVITDYLWKQLGDRDNEDRDEEDEEENLGKRLEFEQVRKKASEEVQRRLGPKIHLKQSNLEDKGEALIFGGGRGEKVELKENILVKEQVDVEVERQVQEDPQLNLNQEFWSQFLGFKTEESEEVGVEVNVGTTSSATTQIPPVNPFYGRFYLSLYDKMKLCLMAPVSLVRVLLNVVLLAVALSLMLIGTCGLSEQEFKEAPLSAWRRCVKWVAAHVVMRAVYFVSGFHWVHRIGTMASAKEAPVIVAAPHSSFFDIFIVPLLGGPSVVARLESSKTPFFGKLMDFTQAIYVDRESSDSRHTCKNEIRRRVRSDEGWPQVFVFPEGTCTNRSALVQFKLGAFQPGVPVQPVVIRYPNRLDSLTWTFDGPSAWWSAFVSLTQFHNSVELEFLPVYTPNEEEKADDILFASNVQKLMAEALGIQATDFTFEDGIAVGKLAKTNVRLKLRSIWKIKGELNVREAATETTLVYESTTSDNSDWKITYRQFQDMFHVTDEDTKASSKVRGLFKLFLEKSDPDLEILDLRPYLILTCLLYVSNAKLILLQTLMFKMYAGKRQTITEAEFMKLMQTVFESNEKDASKLFHSGKGQNNKSSISLNEFQRKIERRVEVLKLYAMEETGQCSGNFPRRSQRDRRPWLMKLKQE